MIRFDAVTAHYPGHSAPVLDRITVEIARGEFVFLVGRSGSGKSTFLRLVLREAVPTRGRVVVAGQDVARLSPSQVPGLRRRIGAVFQDYRLLANRTVGENVAFALAVLGSSRARIAVMVPEVLDVVGLAGKADRFPDELSGGEQQRVAIARALVNSPPLLLADEPTGNLDPCGTAEVLGLLDRIHRNGTTVVMTTHDDRIVDSLRRRVVELDAGRVVRDEANGVYGVAR